MSFHFLSPSFFLHFLCVCSFSFPAYSNRISFSLFNSLCLFLFLSSSFSSFPIRVLHLSLHVSLPLIFLLISHHTSFFLIWSFLLPQYSQLCLFSISYHSSPSLFVWYFHLPLSLSFSSLSHLLLPSLKLSLNWLSQLVKLISKTGSKELDQSVIGEVEPRQVNSLPFNFKLILTFQWKSLYSHDSNQVQDYNFDDVTGSESCWSVHHDVINL